MNYGNWYLMVAVIFYSIIKTRPREVDILMQLATKLVEKGSYVEAEYVCHFCWSMAWHWTPGRRIFAPDLKDLAHGQRNSDSLPIGMRLLPYISVTIWASTSWEMRLAKHMLWELQQILCALSHGQFITGAQIQAAWHKASSKLLKHLYLVAL